MVHKINMMHMLHEMIWYQSSNARCMGRQGTRLIIKKAHKETHQPRANSKDPNWVPWKRYQLKDHKWLPKATPNLQSQIPIEWSRAPPQPKTPSKPKARERRSSKEKLQKPNEKGRKPKKKQDATQRHAKPKSHKKSSKHATQCIDNDNQDR